MNLTSENALIVRFKCNFFFFLLLNKYTYSFQKIVHDFGMEELNNDATKRRLFAFEAYDVLSDPFWREMYDQLGEFAIKMGVFIDNIENEKEKEMKRYAYHGDIFLTYK